jgi:general L-amino acid transport system substrate-binding protein
VTEGAAGLSTVDDRGVWSGLDVDFCAALAAAVFAKKSAVKYIALTAADRFQALKSGQVDVLARSTTWTMTRETELGLRFAPPIFYDGQGFLVRLGQAVGSVLELSGASICVLAGSRGEQSVSEFFAAQKMRFVAVVSEKWADLVSAYRLGGCTVLTGDLTVLARERAALEAPGQHILLPELITKEPFAPAVRQGDERWHSIVRWTVLALIAAEELGVTAINADTMRTSKQQDVRRLLGVEGNLGASLGLSPGWALAAIKQVGNYGEIFERNVGSRSPLKLDRRLNALWSNKGLMYAPPLR